MMQIVRTCTVACLAAAAIFGQTTEEELRSRLSNVHYPPLPQQARIQGDVHVSLNGSVVTLVAGHQLLAPTAMESAKALGSIQNQSVLDVTYHFVLVDTTRSVPTTTTVKRGNAFERAILRIFGRPTEKVVHDYRCEEGVAPPVEVKINGAALEVWIYGKGGGCLQPNSTRSASLNSMVSTWQQ